MDTNHQRPSETHLEYCHTIRQLGQPLIQFFLLIVTGGRLQLLCNFHRPFLDVCRAASSLKQQGVIFGNLHLAHFAKVVCLDVFESQTQCFVSKHLKRATRLGVTACERLGRVNFKWTYSATGGDGHIPQLILPVVAKAGCFNSNHLKSNLQSEIEILLDFIIVSASIYRVLWPVIFRCRI